MTAGRITMQHGILIIPVVVAGTGSYQFSDAALEYMQQIIAGKNQAQANKLLLMQRGVHTVSIQIAHRRTTLPDTARDIAVDVYDNGRSLP